MRSPIRLTACKSGTLVCAPVLNRETVLNCAGHCDVMVLRYRQPYVWAKTAVLTAATELITMHLDFLTVVTCSVCPS